MFKKRTSYEVNVQGITFWRKIINEDNTEVFVKSSLNEPFMIYIDKVKGNEYLDWVTGRPFDMEDMGKEAKKNVKKYNTGMYYKQFCELIDGILINGKEKLK